MKKWLKRLLWLLLLSVLLLVAAGALYVYRALPQTSGTAQLTGLTQAVEIKRDQAGVAHIIGQSDSDVWRALGYLHAQERGWQLEFNRRVMHGELSAVLGGATLSIDKAIRTLGIMQTARAQWAGYAPEVKSAISHYAQGINAFWQDSSQALPPEFHILGIKPGQWLPEDTVAWGMMMALDLGYNWGFELARFSALQKLSTEELWQLMPPYPNETRATTVDLKALYQQLAVYPTTPAPQATSLQSELKQALQQWNLLGQGEGLGSNNWVIAGQRTTTGKPIVANDPHLTLSAPAVWFFAHLQSPEMDVIGATFPGMPFVVLGSTPGVAWAFTNTSNDVQDLYLEAINPANPNQYRIPGSNGEKQGEFTWQDFDTRTETIEIKGQEPLQYTVRSTRHGPVISDADDSYQSFLNQSKYAIALRWIASDSNNQTLTAAYFANRATNGAELNKAYQHYHSPMQNMVWADTTGATGYRAIGMTPKRGAKDDIRGMSPSPGWDAKYDWEGVLSFAQNPQLDDAQIKAKGWHATANQNILPAGYPEFLGQDWILPYRYQRIEKLLAATDKHDVKSVQAIQNDVVSAATLRFLPLLQQVNSQHPLAAKAQTVLANFDGAMTHDSAPAAILNVWLDRVAHQVLGNRLGAEKFSKLYGNRSYRSGVEFLLLDQPAAGEKWCAPQSCAERLTTAFEQTLDLLQTHFDNPEPDTWQWGQLHRALSEHRPFGEVSALRNWFNVDVPSAGDGFTANVGVMNFSKSYQPYANRQAASMRVIYDLADLERSQFIYQTGQSGVVFSSQYRDMAQEWSTGAMRPLQRNPSAYASVLRLQP